ncbi:hypothetical protein DYB25_011455 [Aphanomyces astaci]|uniref:No apical meristem-associated C-terminal domain-containing protein n=1 Tax=Aphanomyces astaci TaxID=112090 RepID=A0A397C5G8_APHAT|nr:hypothetical protein DYB25_011455 [Aphanomyces astaci]RHY38984.1 hypothetical protein DYB34_012540 [Aphanomyces astaci]
MGKGIKWTSNEDNQLARSWVCTSEDPIKGADQTTDSFWANVHGHWSSAAGGEARSTQAMKNRWSILNRSTQKFSGYFAQVKGRKESGKTDEDAMQDAHSLHLSLEHEVFQHEGVWRTLSSSPKWRVLPPSKKLAQLAESFDASDEVGDGGPTRPVGCKKAKRKALEETSVDLKLQDLVRVQEDKNQLFADYMLLQMLLNSTSPQDVATLSQLKADYVSKRSRTDQPSTE